MNKLSNEDRQKLLAKFATVAKTNAPEAAMPPLKKTVKKCDFKDMLLYKKILAQVSAAKQIGIANPFMQCHSSMAKAHTFIDGKDYVNFATYDYLGLNGDPRVN